MAVIVRAPQASDEEAWRPLFEAYLRFYRAKLPDRVVAHTWRRVLDPASDVRAFVAEADGALVGLVHYLFHESTWDERRSCYLQDLYVDPGARGSGAARQLIDAAVAAARETGAYQIYWHTQQYNGAARSLYDTVATPTSFLVYEKSL